MIIPPHRHLWYYFGEDEKSKKSILQCKCGEWKYADDEESTILGIK